MVKRIAISIALALLRISGKAQGLSLAFARRTTLAVGGSRNDMQPFIFGNLFIFAGV